MRKIIIAKPDRHNENNQELMEIRRYFLERIAVLGGLDSCRTNPDLIKEMETAETAYNEKHENIIDRFLYNGTVHWSVEKYDETKETAYVVQLDEGYELLKKKPIQK